MVSDELEERLVLDVTLPVYVVGMNYRDFIRWLQVAEFSLDSYAFRFVEGDSQMWGYRGHVILLHSYAYHQNFPEIQKWLDHYQYDLSIIHEGTAEYEDLLQLVDDIAY